MSARARASAAIARTAGSASRMLGRGGGTAMPGKVLLRLDPGAVRDLAANLGGGTLLISATNGKTTTTRLVAGALRADDRQVVTNAAGANLLSGVATALAEAAPRHGSSACGAFEVDEAALSGVAAAVQPSALLLMNLFRDQLDRHGELESIAARWAQMLATLDPEPTLVVCGDDPLLASLPGDGADVLWFGIDDPSAAAPGLAHASDSTTCRRCDAALRYRHAWIGHIGDWTCPSCGLSRPRPDVAVVDAGLDGAVGSHPVIRTPEGEVRLHLGLPGLHNVLNAAGALAAAIAMGVPAARAATAISGVRAAFGRSERVVVDGREVVMLLAKNPAGANENVRTLMLGDADHDLLVALNDRIADGRDVSWIWDVDWEPVLPRVRRLTATGERAHDLALRFRYAGMPEDRLHVVPDPVTALDGALAALPRGSTLEVLPTYTAMHEIRADLVARGAAGEFWDAT
ncbi:MAG: MurT ligase domain-containing protein [Actinomycetota bacterium]